MRNFHQHGIDTRGRTSGKVKTICPQCNDTRGHKGNKSLSIDLDRGVCYCHHCGYKLYVPDDAEERERQQRKENYNRARKLPSHPSSTPSVRPSARSWSNTGRRNAA